MKHKSDIVVYGASGYTGKLIMESLHKLGLSFVAAGRNGKKIEEAESFMRMLCSTQYFLQDNELVEWQLGKTFQVSVPERMEVFHGSPWGGAAEPVWYLDDSRVHACKVLKRTYRIEYACFIGR